MIKTLPYKVKQVAQTNSHNSSIHTHITIHHQNHQERVTQSKQKYICQNTHRNIT